MDKKKYTLIGKPLTHKEFLERLSQMKDFEDSKGNKYKVRGIIVNALELHAVGEKTDVTRFINLIKLYRNYRMIADHTEAIWPIQDVSELGLDLLVKAGFVGIKDIVIYNNTDPDPVKYGDIGEIV